MVWYCAPTTSHFLVYVPICVDSAYLESSRCQRIVIDQMVSQSENENCRELVLPPNLDPSSSTLRKPKSQVMSWMRWVWPGQYTHRGRV